jgi:hypothetical protein
MKYSALKNLCAKDTFPFDPNNWVGVYPATVDSKSRLRTWSQEFSTNHAFVSGVEGVNASLRINGDNPPHKIHALVLDYDTPVDWSALEQQLDKRLAGAPKPTWAAETWSGNLRLIWELDSPLTVTDRTAAGVLAELAKLVNAPKLHPGLDSTSLNPSQYFDAGRTWRPLGGSIKLEQGVEAAYKVGVGAVAENETDIPFEDIAAEVERRWPGRWGKEFAVGVRGPLFWIDDGIEREGAVIREEGMICYSDRAGAPFVSWGEILGSDFVKKYQTKKIADGVKDIYFDGRDFWVVNPTGSVRHNRENIILHLRMCGFGSDRKKGAKVSELDAALHYIVTTNRVNGAGPYLFRKELIVNDGGLRMVNTSRCKAMDPAADGDPQHWPWLHNFFSQLFDPVADDLGCMPLDFWYPWLARAYKASYLKEEKSGQAVIIAGPQGRGKTLLSQFIVGKLLGGAADASGFLCAKTPFNKALSEVPVWSVDDAVASSNFADHRKFVEVLKKLVANPRIQVEAKFQDRTDIPWFGRAIVTLNEDSNSMSMIPSLESSNRDKLMAFKISENSFQNFLPNDQQEQLILRELPHFARWLLEYTPNPAVVGSPRYGIRSYFHPLVENSARDSSSRQGASELLDIFLRYYSNTNPSEEFWVGTTTELMVEIQRIEELRGFAVLKEPMRFQRDLSSAEEYYRANPGARRITSESTGHGRIWTIQIK